MRKLTLVLLAAVMAIAALPIAAQQPPAQPPGRPADNVFTCTEPRRPVCTREYNPVCATRRDGSRQTYSNPCTACADAQVVSHEPGPCS